MRKLIEEEIYLHNRKHVHEIEIRQLINKISEDILTDYDTQRNFISQLLFVYEENNDHVLSILFTLFINGLEDLKALTIEPLNLSFWDEPFDIDNIYSQFKIFIERNISKEQQIRLSNDLDVTIDINTGGRFLRLIHRVIRPQTIKLNLEADDVNGIMLQLWIARNISRAINRKELFYFIISIFFDTLYFNQNYQFARDLAEECLICSYKDEVPEYGYYLSFKVFGSTSSAVTALHYANNAIVAFLKNGYINDYVLKNFYWEAIKFARNVKLIPYAISIFEKRPLNVSYSAYESNKFFHAYYSSLLFTRDKRLPGFIIEYIDRNKEEIINTGEHEVLPWLSMLFNVKKNYIIAEYDENHFQIYIELFRRIVSLENYNKIYDTLFGTLKDVIAELKKCLLNLTFTRNPSDFITDNKVALQVSHRNIIESFREQNIEGYLLSMILQDNTAVVNWQNMAGVKKSAMMPNWWYWRLW